MNRYLLRRLMYILPQLLILSIIAFGITRLTPGDPAITRMGEAATVEDLERLREHLGLNRPIPEQYIMWVKEVVTLQFGESFTSGQPVAKIIKQRLGPTLLLTATALFIAVFAGILLGTIAAWRRNSLLDHALTFVAFFFVSIPGFWAAIVAIIIFSITLKWFPSTGMTTAGQTNNPVDVISHLVLPATILGLEGMASIARYTRSGLIEVSSQDYIRTARAKGLKERVVLQRHALKNALLPVVTIIGLRIPGLVGGSVLIETVFSWPGMGTAAVEAAYQRDYPVTMALVMVVGSVTAFGNLVADVAYGWLDPRIRQ